VSTKQSQLVLAGLLALQLLLILVLRNPFAEAAAETEPRPLLPALESVTPARVEIRGTEEGEKVTLSRDGGGWKVDELDGFPADGEKIDTLIDELGALEIRRPVVSSGRYHDAFRVSDDDFEARIRLWGDVEDDPAADLIVGKSANYQTSHVRLAGENPVYEVRGLSPYELRPETAAWIDTELVDATAETVTGLSLSNAAGRVDLTKGADGSWSLSGASAPPDSRAIEDLVRAATSLRLAEAAGRIDDRAQGFTAPVATVTLRFRRPESADGAVEERTILVGGTVPGEDAKRYVTRKGLDYAGIVWASSVDRLIEAKAASLATSGAGESPAAG
jgi:hypothetical protein